MNPFLATILLFSAFCLGHLVIWVACHNWWYGLLLPPWVGDLIHGSHGFLILMGPALAYWFVGFDLTQLFTGSREWAMPLAASYVGLCWIVGFVVFPAITAYRWFRPKPIGLIASETTLFDVPKELGYRPTGLGTDRILTSLPGNDVFRVDFTEHTLRLPRLPAAWDGLTILHLSDLHLNGTPDRNFFRAVMDRCTAWKPDLVAVTGDIADSFRHQKWIIPILGRLRWREAGLAILGNHDYWYDAQFIRRRLARLGFHYLGNGTKQLTIRGEPLLVLGNESPWLKPRPDLTGCPEGPFRLCLSHTPDNIGWARKAKVDLMLAGHVHGGQVRLPGIGSILVPSSYGRRFDHGFFDLPPTMLCVSRGLSGEHPLRYFCRPEVVLLRLKK